VVGVRVVALERPARDPRGLLREVAVAGAVEIRVHLEGQRAVGGDQLEQVRQLLAVPPDDVRAQRAHRVRHDVVAQEGPAVVHVVA
jgi:hypothetical protein